MTFRSLLLAVGLVTAAHDAVAQTSISPDACSTLQIRSDEAVLLSRLCAETFYQRHDVAAADAACGAASDRFEATQPASKALIAAGALDACIAEPKRVEQLRILRWVIAYTDYRISGHIPPPDPKIGRNEGRTGATD